MLAALSVLIGIEARAESRTTVTLGPVYFDGKDDYGPDPGEGLANNDWSGARDGDGAKLSLRHDWGHAYIAAEGEWLDIRHRSDRIRPNCPTFGGAPPASPPYENCFRRTARFSFDDDYTSALLTLGWKQPVGSAWEAWGQLGYRYQRWSSSGGSVQLGLGGPAVPLMDVRHTESTWTAAGGFSRRADRLILDLGVNYEPEGYFPSYDASVPNEPLGSSSLLEGIARADWYFTPRWFGRLEYRPSRQRQYLHAGLGIAF